MSNDQAASCNPRVDLLDIQVSAPRYSRAIFYVILLFTSIAVALVVAYGGGQWSGRWLGVWMGASMVVVLIAIKPLDQRNMQRRISGLFTSNLKDNLALLASSVAEVKIGISGHAPVSEMAFRLAEAKRFGTTIRFWWSEFPGEVRPSLVAHEPTLIDEADPAFEDIREAGPSSPREDERVPAQEPTTTRDDVLAMRRIRRNIQLKGGRVAVVLFGLLFLSSVWESYQRRATTGGALFWGGFLLVMLYGPVPGELFTTSQWLGVPGGLVVRKARWHERASRVHLFVRTASVLTVRQLKKCSWMVTVADEGARETTVMTKKEVDFLLSTWLSPLPPPSPERLADWT